MRTSLALVAFVVTPMALLYGLARLSRWYAGRCDPIDSLIVTPHWCSDSDGLMDTFDQLKGDRFGKRVWRETLKAQHRSRKPAKAARPDSRRFLKVVGQ